MTDKELYKLLSSGKLTEVAQQVAIEELGRRGIEFDKDYTSTIKDLNEATKNNNFTKNKWVQFLIVFAVTVAMWSIIDPAGNPFDLVKWIFGGEAIVRFAGLLGVGVALSLLGLFFALVPSAIYRLARGDWPKWQIWLSIPFIAVFMILSYIGLYAT